MASCEINRPKHYIKSSGAETIDAIEIVTEGMNGIEAFCVGNIVKYISRYKRKGGKTDLEKAEWYLNKLIDLEGVNGNEDR